MPEGPEVWILSHAINAFFKDEHTSESYGKHLFISDEDWSFGLTGHVRITDTNEIEKVNAGWLHGDKKPLQSCIPYRTQCNFGANWMTSSKSELQREVDKWKTSKKKLAGLILDQTKIAGIGVAWGSEILHKAGLKPQVRTCDQDISELVDVMIKVREKVKKEYLHLFKEENKKDKVKEFINGWFENLYEMREMKVYKKGTKIEVLGRTWWI